MARLCNCDRLFTLTGKRDVIIAVEPRVNELHSKTHCLRVWHGRNEHGRYGTLPTPMTFTLLGKATP